MADYFPLISRAVAGLVPNSREAREAIYARAREALTRQLTNLDPPIPDADLWRERNALEETIRRVEAQYPTAPPLTVRPEVPPSAPLPQQRPPTPVPTAQANPAPDTTQPSPVPMRVPVSAGRPAQSRAADMKPPRADYDDAAPKPIIVDPTDLQSAPPPPPGPKRPKVETQRTRVFAGRRVTAVAIVLPAMLALAAAAYVMRDQPSMFERQEPVQAGGDPAAQQRKSEGRLDGSAPTASATGPRAASAVPSAPTLPVAARAVFFEETANDPRGVQSDGQVIWRLETVPGTTGLPPVTAVRGSVSFPTANMTLELVFNRNRDAALPASHTIEVVFKPEGNRDGVTEIGPIEARDQETQPGYQLRGAMVPIATNLFLVGLENNPATVARNIEALRDQRFFAFQFRMTNSKVGALLVEKGPTGDKVFREAIDAWGR